MYASVSSMGFLILEPGTVAGLVPFIVSRWRIRDYAGDFLLRPVGILLIVAGLLVVVEGFGRFALQGRGTPAPIYPTRRLIIGGSYRFVRNPLYLAVEALIIGQAFLFGVPELLPFAAIMAVAFYGFVVWVEEPTLKRQFAADYRRYASAVHRWVPRLKPWNPGP